MGLLAVKGLSKSYNGTPALSDLSFEVREREVFGLLGPNGAGKTTTMSILAGLLKPDSGSIEFDGRPVQPRDFDFRNRLGVVPQDLAVYPDLTVRENLDFFGSLYGLKGDPLKQRVSAVSDEMSLSQHGSKTTRDLSGGMKRRLNFAIALLHQPRLLILDEPTVGVDPQSRAHLLDCVRRLSEQGTAVIYASHYMDEVQSLCQRVAIVDHGRLIACDQLSGLLLQMDATVTLKIGPAPSGLLDSLRSIPHVSVDVPEHATGVDRTVVCITVNGLDDNRDNFRMNDVIRDAATILREREVALYDVTSHEPNLEHLFLRLTGRNLRD